MVTVRGHRRGSATARRPWAFIAAAVALRGRLRGSRHMHDASSPHQATGWQCPAHTPSRRCEREKGGNKLATSRLSVYNTDVTKQAMQEPTFLILTALAARPQHGYGIMTEVTSISAGRVRLRAGTLYAALDRLLGDGAVGVVREEVVDGRLRRYYHLTPAGADLLAAETARLRPTPGSPRGGCPGCGSAPLRLAGLWLGVRRDRGERAGAPVPS